MNISIGNDHAGVDYKNYIIKNLEEKYNIVNHGTDDTNSVDYPDHIHPVAEFISSKPNSYGIIICGSGNGAAMTANKHKNIRAALCYNVKSTILSRKHNNANVMTIGARLIKKATALKCVDIFLKTNFFLNHFSIFRTFHQNTPPTVQRHLHQIKFYMPPLDQGNFLSLHAEPPEPAWNVFLKNLLR